MLLIALLGKVPLLIGILAGDRGCFSGCFLFKIFLDWPPLQKAQNLKNGSRAWVLLQAGLPTKEIHSRGEGQAGQGRWGRKEK